MISTRIHLKKIFHENRNAAKVYKGKEVSDVIFVSGQATVEMLQPRAMLDWEPQVELEKGLKETIGYLSNVRAQ